MLVLQRRIDPMNAIPLDGYRVMTIEKYLLTLGIFVITVGSCFYYGHKNNI